MATEYKRYSFLKNAEVLPGDQFLGLNDIPTVLPSNEDQIYIIEQMFDERPDLLSATLYGSSGYWWVFAARNPDLLKDPIRDFTPGKSIIIPGKDSIKQI